MKVGVVGSHQGKKNIRCFENENKTQLHSVLQKVFLFDRSEVFSMRSELNLTASDTNCCMALTRVGLLSQRVCITIRRAHEQTHNCTACKWSWQQMASLKEQSWQFHLPSACQ